MTQILDHGYLNLIETWGSDERIIEAARMSTDKGFQGWGGVEPCTQCNGMFENIVASDAGYNCLCKGTGKKPGDEKLLRYLYEHKHHTPFEMAGMTIEVQAPIFVFREWHRHRTQSYNELSARYTPLPDLFYMPSDERLMMSMQSTSNKQSSEAATFTEIERLNIYRGLKMTYQYARSSYEGLLAMGVSREIARIVVPVGQYSRMRASANLRNWMGFLTLRHDKNAQWEIQQYATQVAELVKENFPRTYALYLEGRK